MKHIDVPELVQKTGFAVIAFSFLWEIGVALDTTLPAYVRWPAFGMIVGLVVYAWGKILR